MPEAYRPVHVHSPSKIEQPSMLPPSMRTTLIGVDIIAFGDPRRDANAQRHLRKMMYEQLVDAFAITGLRWWDCHREDRGDGALIVAPPDARPADHLDPLAHHLTAILRRYNKLAGDTTKLRLRMAVHHGQVHRDGHGVTGHASVHLFRLLEASAFKKILNTAGTDLGVIVSNQLYTDVLQQGDLINPDAYQELRVTCKETRARAWAWLPQQPREAPRPTRP